MHFQPTRPKYIRGRGTPLYRQERQELKMDNNNNIEEVKETVVVEETGQAVEAEKTEEPKVKKELTTNAINKRATIIAVAGIAIITAVAIWLSGSSVTVEKNKQENAAAIKPDYTGIVIDNTASDIGDKMSDPFKDRYVTYQGLTDITISKGTTYQLQNPNKDDDVLMTFSISEDDREITKTDYIPAGKAYEADFAELLGEGSHSVTILMQPYLQTEDGRVLACPVNNSQSMTVIVNG